MNRMTLDRETGAFRLAGIANDNAAKLSQFISISKNDESFLRLANLRCLNDESRQPQIHVPAIR